MQISKFRIPQLYCLKFSFNLANISSRNVKLALQPDTSKQCKTTDTSYMVYHAMCLTPTAFAGTQFYRGLARVE